MATQPSIASMKYCMGCASELHSTAKMCPKCGAPQATPVSSGHKSRVAAIVLALLLGGIGIHKFYLGRIAAGILYILFCWTFIPAIIALVEAIVYATMSEEAFAQKYG